jgi:hypothetical protein
MVVAHREHLRWLLPPHCRIRAAGQDSAPIQAATVRHGWRPHRTASRCVKVALSALTLAQESGPRMESPLSRCLWESALARLLGGWGGLAA